MEKVLVRGICYDAGSSFLRGPAGAPEKIREALKGGSMNLYAENGADLSGSFEDLGDFQIKEYFEIESLTRTHLEQGQKLFTLGGDHSITFPILRALKHRYPVLDILQIDAHPDLYEHYEGDRYSHACPFARIMEEGLGSQLVQVGIRTLNAHQREQATRFGVEMHPMQDLPLNQPIRFSNPVYISLDVDALDPAFAPGVSHREPGGLSTRQVISLLQNLEGEVVGADLVEYNPSQDLGGVTAFVGAKLMKELTGLLVR
ncbi:MAG: agmatinase [Robiginitalea sp.]|nr:agmatinase [Robiginitalea sp.]